MPFWAQHAVVLVAVACAAFAMIRRLVPVRGRKPACGCESCPVKEQAKR
ncbi:MAG: hypothetical protein H0W72_04890 [Planctomycetes bacterium]|nr:hypothetical protein [Planctomycetota bacterium]